MSERLSQLVVGRVARLRWWIGGLFLLLAAVLVATFVGLIWAVWGERYPQWLPELLIALGFLLAGGLAALILVSRHEGQLTRLLDQHVDQEMEQLRSINSQVKTLQTMASTLSVTLDYERVMDVTLEVCTLVLAELGAPVGNQVAAVYLADEETLRPVAHRGFVGQDRHRHLAGQAGALARVLAQTDPLLVESPEQDPELSQVMALSDCVTVICVPLIAGLKLYGMLVLGTSSGLRLDRRELALFSSVADQAVISLQNARLYQELKAEEEKQAATETITRQQLAQALQEGPVQQVATIAMRLSFMRSLVGRNPDQVTAELARTEQLARETVRQIRNLTFSLQPADLRSQELKVALETLAERLRQDSGLDVQISGAELGGMLDQQTKLILFYILEEALANARWHARAKQVVVQMQEKQDSLEVSVRDDGIGFAAQERRQERPAEGLGLKMMAQYARQIGGRLDVQASPGQGTIVTATVPLVPATPGAPGNG
ncbi:MAG: GAF domain-containing protein [Candidatus Promineifilaceae bacterium]|nr:GAF domain-containing protein [Candidatus Promineifilaceae bacterium]